jgi:hypothetical protein
MFTDESATAHLLNKIENFPLIKEYLTPSLKKRVQSDNWYDNRVIVYILRNAQWVNRLERTFSEAQLDTILNSEEIFGLLNGTEEDYDQQLFDAIAEVRLARWGISQGYSDIVKLKRAKWPTPDFCMIGKGKTILAEARHFRPRDYVLDYVYDRLYGLALKTGYLAKFGLLVEAESR